MIAIVDFGLGNVNAFANVYKRLNLPAVVAKEAAALEGASKIILPGVGAFDYAMMQLDRSGMRECIEESVLEKKIPILGVCVGMQILADSSEEGRLPGLGWISGAVRKFQSNRIDANPLPHMGWNTVNPQAATGLFKNFGQSERFYFLHSYYYDCRSAENAIASTNYGENFTCGVSKGNCYGVQFHPEKSHQAGIQLLKNFGCL